jgi:Uma2 family endonuclease
MSTIAVIPEEKYLSTVYEPDCEFEDGVRFERNSGEQDHSWLQAALAAYFFQRRKLWRIEVYTEQRHRIRKGKYMMPDVCVISQPRPVEKVFSQPPLIWIEILSPEDRPLKVNSKVRQLLEFGAPNIWVIDPETFDAEIHTPTGSWKVDDGILRVAGGPIEVPLRGLEE